MVLVHHLKLDDLSTKPFRMFKLKGLTAEVVDPIILLCRAELRVKNIAYTIAASMRLPSRMNRR